MARYGHSPHPHAPHLNGNLLAAVDCETTGTTPGHHDIVQVAILPLGPDLRPIKKLTPFYFNIKPKFPENADPQAMRVNKLKVSDLEIRGICPWTVADLLVEWFESLGLPNGRKIMPLAHNWCFDRDFIIEWLGPGTFETIFHFHYRDSQVAALYLNDRAHFWRERIENPKVGLDYCCNVLGVTNPNPHDALGDCIATAEVYRRLMQQFTASTIRDPDGRDTPHNPSELPDYVI